MSRILHVLSQIPSLTGSGVYLDNISRLAQEEGHHQALVVGLPLADQGRLDDLLKTYEEVFPLYFDTEDLPFAIPGMSDVMPYESTRFSSLDDSKWLRYNQAFETNIIKAIETFKPQVILCHHLWAATAAVVTSVNTLALNPKPRLFGISHGTDIRQMKRLPHMQDDIRSKCQGLDQVFGLHQEQLHEIHTLYQIPYSKLNLSGNGYNEHLFYPRQHDKNNHQLIYAGKLSLAKGVMALLEALLRVNEKLPVQLVLAGQGSGPEAEAIYQRIDEINHHSPLVSCLGFVAPPQLAQAFSESSVFVLPSFYEGLPLVILEALATGLPVVVNDLPGLKPWLGEDINQSGMIHYVPMPKLIGIDTIDPKGRDAYIDALAEAIFQAFEKKDQPISYPQAAIASRSWRKVYQALSAFF